MRWSRSELRTFSVPLLGGSQAKTSAAHATQPDQSNLGVLLMMACPPRGKDLGAAMDALRARGVGQVISLLPDYESQLLGVGDEAEMCARAGLGFENFPISDFGIPQDSSSFIALADRLDDALQAQIGCAVHCRAGIGRTGLLVGAVLVRRGQHPEETMRCLHEVRGVPSPEAPEQREWLRGLAARPRPGTEAE